MSEQVSLAASERQSEGKSANRNLRRSGYIPGVLYGGKDEPKKISIMEKDIVKATEIAGFATQILQISMDGKDVDVVVKEIQRHPATSRVLHADFMRVDPDSKITLVVPIRTLNDESCIGVKVSGGQVNHLINDIEISCLASNLPEQLEIDVQEMDIGDTVSLSEIKLPEGVEITILYHATDMAIGRPPRGHEAEGFLRLMSCTGVSMKGHPDLHAKHVIADDTSGLLFTANLDGNHGLNTGIEVGVRLSKEASQQLSEWHDTLFDSFPLELVISPTISELSKRKGTKLVQLPDGVLVSSVKQFDKIKRLLSEISEKSTVICKRKNRWIEPENKGDRWTPKPYESRVEVPSIDSGLLLDGINLMSKGKHIDVDLSENSDFGLHHAHIAPGKYNLSLLKPYTDDEILELIEQHLPVPKEGVALKEIFAKFKENISSPKEISFELNAKGFADYIQRKKNRGLLRVHEIKGQKIFPIKTEEDESVDSHSD